MDITIGAPIVTKDGLASYVREDILGLLPPDMDAYAYQTAVRATSMQAITLLWNDPVAVADIERHSLYWMPNLMVFDVYADICSEPDRRADPAIDTLIAELDRLLHQIPLPIEPAASIAG